MGQVRLQLRSDWRSNATAGWNQGRLREIRVKEGIVRLKLSGRAVPESSILSVQYSTVQYSKGVLKGSS